MYSYIHYNYYYYYADLRTCPQGHDGGVEGGVLLEQTPLPHHDQNQTSSINATFENEKAEYKDLLVENNYFIPMAPMHEFHH